MRFKRNFNKRLKKLIVLTLVCSVFFAIPVYAAEKKETDTDDGILEYEEIKEKVLENNLQLKSSELSVKKLRNKIDSADEDAEELEDSLYGMVYSIDGLIDSMDKITAAIPPANTGEEGSGIDIGDSGTGNPDTGDSDTGEPDGSDAELTAIKQSIGAVAGAARFSLYLTRQNLYSQIDSLEDSTDGLEDQLDLAEVNTEQAKAALVNTTQNLYILYHQLGNNLEQLENNRALMQKQLEVAEVQVKYGLGTQSAIKDVKSSLLELDASRSALEHQRDSLLLQMKGLLGLTYEDRLSLGGLPQTDDYFIDSIHLGKDIETAAENSMSVKIKKEELDTSSVYGDRRKYELQAKENDAALALTKQYHTLAEAKDKLMLSESKLEDAAYELVLGQAKYGAGLLSEIELKVLENDVKTKELEVRSNRASLFCETENYKAMKDGLL